MATNISRWTSVVTGLIDRTPTNTELLRLAKAVTFMEEAATVFDAMEPNEKAGLALRSLRKMIKGNLTTVESISAQQQAVADVRAGIDASFPDSL